MSRVPYLRDDEAGPVDLVAAIRQRRGGQLLHLDRLLLYSPPVATGWNELLGAVRNRLVLPARLREIAMCAVATLNHAPYEFHHHAPELIKAGGTPEQVDALREVAFALTRPDLFDPAELAVLRLAAEMTQGVRVQEQTFSALQDALQDDRLVVESVVTVAAYNMVSRVIVALQIEPEAPADGARTATAPRLQRSGRINVPGAAIAYRLEGPEGAPVLMLAHGLAADMGQWEQTLERLTSVYRVLRLDLRGHGASSTPPPGNYDIGTLSEDVIALLDALQIQRVHLVGVGLGGMLAQQVAARFPNRVVGLVLAATMAVQAAPQAWADRIARVRADGLEAIVEGTLQRWFAPGFLERRPDMAERMRSMIRNTREDAWLGCAETIRDLAQFTLLEQLRAPTLLVAGARDDAATPDLMRTLQAQIAGASLAVLDHVGHAMAVESPDAFCALVLDFLQALDRSASATSAV